MCVYVRVCAHTHPYTLQVGNSDCEPRARDRDEKLGGPEEFRWTKSQQTCIRTSVQSTFVYIYWEADRYVIRNVFSLNTCLLPKKKSKRCERDAGRRTVFRGREKEGNFKTEEIFRLQVILR